MAVTFTSLLGSPTIATTSNLTDYTTASLSPSASKLYLVGFHISDSTASTDTVNTTVAGWGLTWTRAAQSTTSSVSRDVAVWYATGSPTAGVITITIPNGGTGLIYSVYEVSGADLSNPIVQADGGRPGSSTSLSQAFPSTINAANGAFAFAGTSVAETPTAGTGWGGTGANHASPNGGGIGLTAEPATQTIAASTATSANWFYAAVEIRASSGTSHSQSPSESLGLTDAVSIARTVVREESVDITDAVSRTYGRLPADSLGLTDAVALGQSASPADSLGLTDSASAVISKVVTESLGLTDVAAVDSGRLPVDPVDLVDDVQLERVVVLATPDSLGLTDVVSALSGTPVFDTLGLTDEALVTLGIPASDALGLTDTADVVFDRAALPADALGLTDLVTSYLDLGRPVADTLDGSDAASFVQAFVLNLPETVALRDREPLADGPALTIGTVIPGPELYCTAELLDQEGSSELLDQEGSSELLEGVGTSGLAQQQIATATVPGVLASAALLDPGLATAALHAG